MCPAISKKEQLFMADRFSSALLSPVNQEPVALESDAERKRKKKVGKGRKSGGRDLHLHAGGRESANSHSLQGRAKAILSTSSSFRSEGAWLMDGPAEFSGSAVQQFHS